MKLLALLRGVVAAIVFYPLVSLSFLLAQVPSTIAYQGVLAEPNGRPVSDGYHLFTVRFYTDSTTRTHLYKESQTIPVINGVFNLIIGASLPIPASVFAYDHALYMGILLDNDLKELPRSQLSSTPYALHAATAQRAMSVDPTAVGVVTNINNQSGQLLMRGAGGTVVSSNAGIITIASPTVPDQTGVRELHNTDGTLRILNPYGPVTLVDILDESIGTSKLADASIITSKLAPGVIPTALPPIGAAGGILVGSYPNPELAMNAVSRMNLADSAVTSEKLALNAVHTASLSNGSVTTEKLTDAVVTTAKIADGSVTGQKIADASIQSVDIAPGVIPVTLPPTGTAGGNLTGTYPNPIIANNAVVTAKIADGAVTDIKLGINSVTSAKIADGTIQSADLASGVIPSSLPPSGTAGGDLTGNYPSPTITNNAITSAKINDGTIVNADISVNASIAYTKLTLFNSIITSDLTGACVTSSKLAADAVTTSKIADNAVQSNDIKDGEVGSADLADGAVTSVKIADGAVTDAKVAAGISYAKLTGAPASLPPTGVAGGDLSGSFPNPVIATGAITSAKILDGDIVNADLSSTAGISYSKLNLTNSIQSSDLVSGSVTGPKIGADAVTTSKIADNTVGSNDLKDGDVQTVDLADGSVTSAKLHQMGAGANQVLKWNGASWQPNGQALGNFTESIVSTAPNGTIPVAQLSATGAQATIDAVFAPKGNGALLVQSPDNTVAGGVKRGTNAIDLQSSRVQSTQVASGQYAVIIGGRNNTAAGINSVAMGYQSTAAGDNSVAIGSIVSVTHPGSCIIGDNSATVPMSSSSANELSTRFDGGYRLFTKGDASTGVYMSNGANSWSSVSDSTKKTNYRAIDGEDVLKSIGTMKLGSWNYRSQNKTVRHYGPMAQEFFAEFGQDGIGTIGCDTLIASADIDGVMMIALQALEKRTHRIKALERAIKSLEKKIEGLINSNTNSATPIRETERSVGSEKKIKKKRKSRTKKLQSEPSDNN